MWFNRQDRFRNMRRRGDIVGSMKVRVSGKKHRNFQPAIGGFGAINRCLKQITLAVVVRIYIWFDPDNLPNSLTRIKHLLHLAIKEQMSRLRTLSLKILKKTAIG